MIRKSTAIATAAIFLSLLFHLFGLGITFRNPPEKPEMDASTESVVLGNTFEDLAETPTEPVQPEPASVPDPPIEALPEPEPERAVAPTSHALVASNDPKNTDSPDTGSAEVVQPDTVQPSEPEVSGTPGPETVEPTGGDGGLVSETLVLSPVEPDGPSDAPEGTPDGIAEAVEARPIDPMANSAVAPVPTPETPKQFTTTSARTTPTLPITPVLEATAIPIVPTDRETVDPTLPEATVQPVPETSDTAAAEIETGGTDLAVSSSQRPQPPTRRLNGQPNARFGGPPARSDLIESPLLAYQRTGSLDGWPNGTGSRGPGNSDVTNYAGRVLVHLNRTPAPRVRTPGSARVTFEINRDGTLAWVDVTNSTGTHEFDSAARTQVRNAVPFPTPPQGANRRLNFIFRSN